MGNCEDCEYINAVESLEADIKELRDEIELAELTNHYLNAKIDMILKEKEMLFTSEYMLERIKENVKIAEAKMKARCEAQSLKAEAGM